jgi:hypothetical protein
LMLLRVSQRTSWFVELFLQNWILISDTIVAFFYKTCFPEIWKEESPINFHAELQKLFWTLPKGRHDNDTHLKGLI